jgi:Leucine-rich repeat (LRR) protein
MYVNLNGNTLVKFKRSLENLPLLKGFYASNLKPDSLKNINFSLIASLAELNLSFNNLSNIASFFEYKNIYLNRLWLRGSVLNSDLSFMDKFVNLIEVDLSCVRGVSWQNKIILSVLVKLEIIKMSGLNLSSHFVHNSMTLDRYKNLVYLDLSSNSLDYFKVNFKSIYKLKFIILTNNYLKTFDFTLFTREIVKIDLGFNRLADFNTIGESYVREAAILNNNNISEFGRNYEPKFYWSQMLDLSFNKIISISSDTFKRYANLKYLK